MVQKAIGELLKERRSKLDWSLDQAERITSIKKIYISALETDNYMAMPGPFYVRAYLKQYADKLDLDVASILEAYDNDKPVEVEGPLEDTGNYRFIRPDERIAELENIDEEPDQPSKFRRYLPMTILSSIAIIILLAVGLVVFLNRNDSNHISSDDYKLAESSSSKKASDSSSSSSTATSSAEDKFQVSQSGTTTLVNVNSHDNPINLTFSLKDNVQNATISISDSKGKQELALSGAGQSAGVQLQKDANQVMITYSRSNPVTIKINNQDLKLTDAQASAQTLKLEIKYQ